MDHNHEPTRCGPFHPIPEAPNPQCPHCGGTGWIGDLVCPACS